LQAFFEETVARHTAKHGLRTYDILNVVSARLLGCDHFFSFDKKANKLAKIEGLKVGPL
jgi:predicted nucleic acid-binding protein